MNLGETGEVAVALCLLCAISGTGALAMRRYGRRGLFTTGLAFTVPLASLVVWDRARTAGTLFQYEEPLWVSLLVLCLVVIVPLLVGRLARKQWPIGPQIAFGAASGVVTYFVVALLLFTFLTVYY